MFERLTQRCDLGLSEFEEICFINPDDVEGMYTLDEIVDFGSHETRLAIAKRLAAYEDSGLTPEEVKRLVISDESKEQSSIEWFNRAKELQDKLHYYAQAKAEGRLVVLPCKVGDAVYAITRCEDIMMHHDNDYLNGTGAVECPFDSTCDLEECDDENLRIFETECTGFWLEEGIKGIYLANLNMECYISDFGKTVFRTREEAEKALREGLE